MTACKDDEAIKKVLKMAFAKYRGGAKKHGEVNIDADPRNFLRESIDELLDSIVYNCFEVERLLRVEAKVSGGMKELVEERLYLNISSQDIAARAGLTREQVDRVVAAYRSEKKEK